LQPFNKGAANRWPGFLLLFFLAQAKNANALTSDQGAA
jgi:hypothetical protein